MAQQTFEELVAAVKQAESRGKRYADDGKTLTTSPKGALGEMQVMPKTIRDPGFGVTPAKDKSPDEIARVGVDYLQAMKQKYGDTEKALIAYNWGPGSTDKWLASGADPKKLPAETRTYVERVKGFLGGKDVPRETSVAKKEREPLPPSLPPMAQAPAIKPEAAARVASLGPGYQAALALSFLAETDDEEDRKTTITQEYLAKAQEEEDDRAATAAIAKRQSNVFADLSNTTIRSPFAEPQQPVMMKDGGDVEGRPRNAKSLMEKFKDLSFEYKKDPIAFMREYKVPTSPMGVGLTAGYAAYKHVTGKDPLSDLQKELSQRLNPEIDTGDTESMPISVGLPPVRRANGSPEEGERLTPQQIERITAQGPTERKDEPFFDAASRTYVDVLTGRREPITAKDFTAKEQMAMMDAVRRSQARGGKGRVDYEDYPTGDQIGPDYVDIRNTLGGFQYKQGPDGSTIITDRYDFHGPRVAEYEKMGTGEKLVKSAKNALTEFVKGGFSPRDLAGELGRAYVGSKGPEVNIRIPVNRADGSPPTGERKLDPETIRILRNEGTSPASLKRVDPPLELNPSAAGLPGLMMYNDPSLTRTTTSGYILDSNDNKKNFGMAQAMFLNPSKGEGADTVAHETEHLLARQNLGSGANVNSKFDELIGDKGNSRLKFVRKAVELGPYLEEKYNIKNAYFDPKMLEFQSKFGMGKNLLYEQLASLSAAEQRLKVDLTKDPELRKTLFSRPDVRETYNAITGLRQTRLDPRDLSPYTRVAEPGMLDAIKGVFKRAEGGPVYRAEGSPEEGEVTPRLTMQQIERLAAQEAAEREAASTPAFIAQKSGIGRKAGPVSQALQSGQGQIEFLKGMTNVPQNILGAPMDISNMIANVYGGGVEKPFMGSEYIKEGLRSKGLGFTPSTDPTLAGFYGAGDLGSNLVNPAGVTRAGVKAAEKTGEAAKMLARDFQGYNQQLAAPGASYAIRNKGTPFIMRPESTTAFGTIRPEMNEADAHVAFFARMADTESGIRSDNPALADWVRNKVGAYLRRDFGTEQDQMVQAAEKGQKLHFMSPRFLENDPYSISKNLAIDREREGFPKAGFAKTAKGQEVEAVIDSSIYPVQLQDLSEKLIPPSLKKFQDTNPEMRLSEMSGSATENLKLEVLVDEMKKMFKETEFKAYGERAVIPKEYTLTEDTLKGLTPAQASNRVANKQEWVAKKRAELAGVAISKDPQIVSQSYDNGSKWISPADLADNAKHEEMVKDIGCAGGWCTDKSTYALDYGSGENRLNILLDKKFEPRVQLTVNSPPVSVREFILANPNLPEIDAMTRDRTLTKQRADEMIRAMPEYQEFVKNNQDVKRITEIKGQFNNSDLRNSPYLKQVQDFVKRQGPDLLSVDNLDGINMVDARVELAKSLSTPEYMKKFNSGYIDKLRKLNGDSYYVDAGELPGLLKKVEEYTPPNAARAIQMNLFQTKATGGMIERQPNDNRRYM